MKVYSLSTQQQKTLVLPTSLDPLVSLKLFARFFHVKNYEGGSQPLPAVQVTELADDIFIGCTINHVVVDGKSFWHFINSLAEISNGCLPISKHPIFQCRFQKGIECPILLPFTKEHKIIITLIIIMIKRKNSTYQQGRIQTLGTCRAKISKKQ